MKTLTDRINSIIEKLTGKEVSTPEPKTTIRTVMQQVEDQFKEVIDIVSTTKIVQFPMVFEILLSPQDYNNELLQQATVGMLKNLIADFYYIIKEELKSGNYEDYNAANKYWQFRISACDFVEKDGKQERITPGRVITIMDLFSADIRDVSANGGDARETMTRKSVKDSRKSLTGTAINFEILRGGMYLSNNTFIFDFDPDMSQDLKKIGKATHKNILASITWKSDIDSRKSIQPFLMMENTVIVSGKKETRDKDNPSGILKIDMNQVEKDHVHIRYSEKAFQICAYADGVRVDETLIHVSKDSNPIWQPLEKESEIIIRDVVTITFKAL